jgi:hypothetical protein
MRGYEELRRMGVVESHCVHDGVVQIMCLFT